MMLSGSLHPPFVGRILHGIFFRATLTFSQSFGLFHRHLCFYQGLPTQICSTSVINATTSVEVVRKGSCWGGGKVGLSQACWYLCELYPRKKGPKLWTLVTTALVQPLPGTMDGSSSSVSWKPANPSGICVAKSYENWGWISMIFESDMRYVTTNWLWKKITGNRLLMLQFRCN